MKNIRGVFFFSKIVQFLEVKFSIHLKRHVFVMLTFYAILLVVF